MIQSSQILETLRMIDQEKLDVRTITMGISLFNCVCDDTHRLASRVYGRIARQAESLVKVGQEIEVFQPTGPLYRQKITSMIDNETNEEISVAPHPQQIIRMKMEQPVEEYTILRRDIVK